MNKERRTVPRRALAGVLCILVLGFASCATTPEPGRSADPDGGRDSAAGEAGGTADEYRSTLVSLLETFDALVVSAENDDELAALYREVRKHFGSGTIRFRTDTRELESSLRRSRFTIDSRTGNAVLLIHYSLLDMADENPVPAMSEIAANISRIGDYIEYGLDMSTLYSDPLEYYLANMNAVYLQSIFLRDYALPVYGEESLSDYDNYVLQSLEVDGFSSLSLFVWGLDKDIIYSMLGLSTQLSNGGVSKEAYVEQVLQLGREIRNNMEQSRRLFQESGDSEGDDRSVARRTMYIAATSARTYRTLGSVIFSTVINERFSAGEYEEHAEKIEEVNQLYALLKTLLSEVDDFRREYRSDYLGGF